METDRAVREGRACSGYCLSNRRNTGRAGDRTATADKNAVAPHLLVVIDHQEARVYRTEVGAVVVDAHHTTEAQLLARAREFYAEFNKK